MYLHACKLENNQTPGACNEKSNGSGDCDVVLDREKGVMSLKRRCSIYQAASENVSRSV